MSVLLIENVKERMSEMFSLSYDVHMYAVFDNQRCNFNHVHNSL